MEAQTCPRGAFKLSHESLTLKHYLDVPTRTRRADTVYEQAEAVRQQIETAYNRQLTLVIGGTPTFPIHARRPADRLETSPGTFVFWDAGYAKLLPDLPFEPAAGLLTRVISVVDEQTLTFDLGYKSVASEKPLPRVVFPDHPDVRPIEQNEEHLIVNVPNARRYPPGTAWFAIPQHICPTVALYDAAYIIQNGAVVDRWPISRERE